MKQKVDEEYSLQKSETISNLDVQFARLMIQLSDRKDRELFIAAALVSSQTRAGHICLDLANLDDQPFLQEKLGDDLKNFSDSGDWQKKLSNSSIVGKPGEFKPFILDNDRLYLNRYWQYQEKLAIYIKNRVQATENIENIHALQRSLEEYFPKETDAGTDWQKIAAITAIVKKFCVICGGPGTGKTYTVAKIIALLVEQADKNLRIVLAAPTGKAAVRLQDSIKRVKKELSCSDEIKLAIPEEAATIHRLLGYVPHSPYFWHNEKNPLLVDVMIVDEASMVDLALLSKLVQALPPQARLILLGDNNQLASVEAGAVLADICDTSFLHACSSQFVEKLELITGQKLDIQTTDRNESEIQDCIIELKKSYRFESQKGIGALSRAVNAGEGDLALQLLQDKKLGDIEWHELGSEDPAASILAGFRNYTNTDDLQQIFERFEKFRILCAVKEGPFGVNTINSQIEQFIKKRLRIKQSERCYSGQPILITQNDYNLHLFNGDMGIILPARDSDDELRAHFPGADGKFRKFRPFRLPEHQTAYAMTVHKSQGSEFQQVLLLLPEKDAPIVTRELIYTGITRAAKKVDIWGNENVFRAAVTRRIRRTSGLRDMLWQATDKH